MDHRLRAAAIVPGQIRTTSMYIQLTEEQIERRAERNMDALDRCLMRGSMDQATYDAEVKKLDRITRADLARAKREG